MDYADAATTDTVASGRHLDSARKYKNESRMLKDERGQMVQLSNEWELLQQDFKLLEICGEGSFGRVVRAKHRVTKKEVAIK
jgi:serine/threonine protein kinase